MICPYYVILTDEKYKDCKDAKNNPEAWVDFCVAAGKEILPYTLACQEENGYETCGFVYSKFIPEIENKLVDLMRNGIQNAGNEINALFDDLWGVVRKTQYRDLYNVVHKAQWQRQHFDFSESYNILIVEDSSLMDRLEEQINFLKHGKTSSAPMILGDSMDISEDELANVLDTAYPRINAVKNCFLCEEIDQINNQSAVNARRIMDNMSNVVMACLNNMYQEIYKIKDNFARKAGKIIEEARRDRGSVLRRSDVNWRF